MNRIPLTDLLSSYANARLAESQNRTKDAFFLYKKAIYRNEARDLALPGYALLLQKLGHVDRAIHVVEKVGSNKKTPRALEGGQGSDSRCGRVG